MALTQVSRGLLSTSIVDNGNATAITIDSSENVGIGTTSPGSFNLNINGAGDGGRQLKVEGTGTNGLMRFSNSTAQDYSIGINSSSFIIYDDTANSYRMIVDSSGDVGIGSTNADAKFKVELNPSGTVLAGLRIGYNSTSANYFDGDTQFFRNGAGNSERMRIDSSGNLLVGTTTVPSGGTDSKAVFKSNNSLGVQGGSGSNTGDIRFYNPSGAKYWNMSSNQTNWYFADGDFTHYAYLTQNMTAWAFGSDRRLKESIVDASYGLDAVMAIQPRAFTFKSSGVKTIGFIAQELQAVVPEAVTGTEIEYLDNDTPQEKANKSLGVSKITLVPVLVKAIQEQQATIEALTQRLTALENN